MTNNYNLSFENRTARFPKRIDIDPTASSSPRILPFHPLSRKTIIVQLRIRRGSIPSRTMSGINRRGRAARGENPLAPCTQHTSPIRTPLDPRWRHIGPRRIATKVDVSISHDRNEQRHAVVTPMSILLSLGNVVGPRFIIRTRVPRRYTRSIQLVFRRIIRVHRLPLLRSN